MLNTALPLVSIITPSFNSEKYIAETIKSVQNQSYANWELIIVDDCSTDQTEPIIRNFVQSDSRIHSYQLKRNSGAGIARNEALKRAKGDYIAFLDSDDLWKPKKLSTQIKFMQDYELPFTFSFYDCINEEGISMGKRVEAPLVLSYYQLFFCNYIGNLSGIYSVDYFGKIPISPFRKRQDWMVWLHILKEIRTARPVPESLAYYRIRTNSMSSSKGRLLKHNFFVYRFFHKFNTVLSLCCMVGFLYTQLLIKPQYSKVLKAEM